MSKYIFIFLVFCSSTTISSQGISFFHGTWEEALVEAQKSNKIVFVDAYAKWCGPCKVMAKNVFTQDEVGTFFNENFINLKLDMEEKDGMSFGRKYPVSAYPTLFFLNSTGELIQKSVGGKKADALLGLAIKVLKSHDNSGQYAELYDAGERDFDLMVNYVSELNKVGKPSLKIANDYIDSNPDISDDQKALFLFSAVTESDSKVFENLMPLKSNILTQVTKEEYEEKINLACLKSVEKAVEYEYEELLINAIEKYKLSDAGDSKKFELLARLKFNELSSNYEAWVDLSKKYLNKYGKKQPELYKNQLGSLQKSFNYVEASKEYANDIAKDLVKYDASTANYMLYIGMLMSCKQHDEAQKVTEDAIKKAKKNKEKTEQLEQYLEFIKQEIQG